MKKTKTKSKVKVSLLSLLEEQVDVERLLNNVELREEQIIEAALAQPSLVMEAGKSRVQAFHKRAMLESKLKLVQAKAGLRLRRIREPGGKREFTEGAVKERIELQPLVQKVRKRLDIAYSEEEMGKLLQEVFRTRSDAIRNIVNAGKVSVHAKELELLRSNKSLGRAVSRIRDKWNKGDDSYE